MKFLYETMSQKANLADAVLVQQMWTLTYKTFFVWNE